MSFEEKNNPYGQPQPSNDPYGQQTAYGQAQATYDPYGQQVAYGQTQTTYDPYGQQVAYGQAQTTYDPYGQQTAYGQAQTTYDPYGQQVSYEQAQASYNPYGQQVSYEQAQVGYDPYGQQVSCGQPQTTYGQEQQLYNQPAQKEKNGAAITGLVMGILSLTGCFSFLSIPGLIFSILGLKKRSKKAAAIAGLILSIIGVIVFGAICLSFNEISQEAKAIVNSHNNFDFGGPNSDGYLIEIVTEEMECTEQSDVTDSTDAENDTTVDGTTEKEVAVTLSELDARHISIMGTEYVIDEMKVADVENAIGYEFDEFQKGMIIEPGVSAIFTTVFEVSQSEVEFYFTNNSSSSLEVTECPLTKIKMTNTDRVEKSEFSCVDFDMGDGITNSVNVVDLYLILGQADSQYTEDEIDTYVYSESIGDGYGITFEYYDGKVVGFTIGQYN